MNIKNQILTLKFYYYIVNELIVFFLIYQIKNCNSIQNLTMKQTTFEYSLKSY